MKADDRYVVDNDEQENHGWTDDLDAMTVVLLLLVAVFGLLTIAAQVGMWIGRQ